MTIPGLGKLTPIQFDMILLSGCLIREFYPDGDKQSFSETERLWSMKRARTGLARLTGEDFGYDLSQWNDYLLMADDDHGYTHPYGWSQTKKIVEQRISDPEARRLALKAAEQNEELGWHHRTAPSKDRLDPQIKNMLANLRNEIPPSDTNNYLDAESAYNILVAMTGLDFGLDPDRWEAALVTKNAT